MKFSNLKAGTYSLIAILFLAFSFTACTSEEDNQLRPASQEITFEKGLVLPSSITSNGAEYTQNYLSIASGAELIIFQNNHVVGQHLSSMDKISEVIAKETTDVNFAEVNLTQYLNDNQIQTIQLDLTQELQFGAGENPQAAADRGCVPIRVWNGWEWVTVGWWCY